MKKELYILLIEDSEIDAELIERELGRENYQLKVRRVQTKQELTEALDQTMPDLILSDYSLPAFSAVAALKIIGEKAPQIPVIIVSGTIGEERAIEVLKSGATDYVLKDRITRLLPAVQRALRDAQQQAEKKSAEEYLRLLEKAIENMQLGVTVTDLSGKIIYTNAAEARMHGYKVQDLIGRDARIFAPRELWKTMMTDDLREIRSWRRESTNIREDGTIFPVQITSDVVGNPDGKAIGIVSICEDITERKRAQDAFYDALTSLPNRALFMDRLSRALKRIKRRHDYLFAILLLNLDRFKAVNDALGHQLGDHLLVACSRRMESCLRFGDTVARLHGDSYCILLDDIHDVTEAAFVAQRVQKQLAMPFHLDGHEVHTTASIGIVEGSSAYDRPEEVVLDATTAMQRAKALGRKRYEVFDKAMRAAGPSVQPLESGLRRAAERQELMLYYQPIVSLESGKVVCLEALLRWRNPERGLMLPDDFIPLAEETGLIVPIGYWALKTACSQLRDWRSQGLPVVRVAVNVSARQLEQRDFTTSIANILRETDLSPDCLELELTETLVVQKAEKVIQTLSDLKKLGIGLAIDDFGTGYSSLGYLKRFFIDTLKIDRSFVRDITIDPKDDAIATSVIQLAHSLQLRVVAEGVETEEQLAFLRWHHCDEIQGHLVSPAIPPDQAAQLLSPEKTFLR